MVQCPGSVPRAKTNHPNGQGPRAASHSWVASAAGTCGAKVKDGVLSCFGCLSGSHGRVHRGRESRKAAVQHSEPVPGVAAATRRSPVPRRDPSQGKLLTADVLWKLCGPRQA